MSWRGDANSVPLYSYNLVLFIRMILHILSNITYL